MAIYLNEDYENFMAFRSADEMNEECLKKQIDDYFDSQVSTILFNANAQRAFFDSRTIEPIWQGMEKGGDGKFYFRGAELLNKPLPTRDNAVNAKRLHENVADPFQFRIDCARKNGGSGWLSMRMNDIHLNNNIDALMHSELWRENPAFRLERHKSKNGTGLDFACPEVRKRVLSLILEYFERFDMDGFELDWMRTPPFFTGGREDENRGIPDEIVRTAKRVSRAAEKRTGHKIKISVRVPSRPEEALRLGLDVIGWARHGWIDTVTPCAFIDSTDGSMPLEIWRALLPGRVELIPGIDILTSPHPDAPVFHNLAEFVNGFAAAFFYRGIQDIYLFNHMDRQTGLRNKTAYRELLQHAGTRESVEKTFRRHVATMVRNQVPGIRPSASLPLPGADFWQDVRIEVGGGTEGRKVQVILAVESADLLPTEDFEVRVDGTPCRCGKTGSDLEFPPAHWQKLTYEVPENALRPGSAVVEFKGRRAAGTIQWCEIDLF
ncbi:MAG: hypothetical protein BWY31_04383 [Lentisphaerae bacterium ADurb.Bin242]|nr:MAG: hypothetical protein BWY31_04383 [Lentisphaerae bacterium ADurb.Bin242]